MAGQATCAARAAGSTRPAAGRPAARARRPGIFRNCAARAFGLGLAALCLLPDAALGNGLNVRIKKVTLEGSTAALPSTGIEEGQTILVHIRADSAPNPKHMRLRFRVEDDPRLDLLAPGYNANDPHVGVGEGTLTRQFHVTSLGAVGDATHTIRINTRRDAKCGDGQIKVTLLEGDTARFPNQGNYRIDTTSAGKGLSSVTIPVRDAGPCPVISIEPDAALERDGVTEGGAFGFTLKRINPNNDDPGVELNWEIVDDGARDFLARAAEGRKKHKLGAYAIGDGGATNAEYEVPPVQTRLDPGSGSGAVTVRLLANDYYKLGTKTTLTVPVKDDTGYAGRVLRIGDFKVAEDHRYRAGLAYVQGFRLPVRLSGDIAKSATDPSVRAQFVAGGGGCRATAKPGDLGQPGTGNTVVPRTAWPAPKVLTWDRGRPAAGERAFDSLLMNDRYHEGDETLCVKFDRPRSLRLPGGVDEYVAAITLTDDDPAPSIAVDTPRAAEGDGTLDFTVTLTNPPEGKNVTLRYKDNGTGSATSGTDYEALANGTLTFPADEGDAPQKKKVKVTLKNDSAVEADETVALRFSRAENADFEGGARGVTVRGVIADDDSHAPQVRLREAAPGAGPVTVQEGGTAVFHADIWVHENGAWKIGALDQDVRISWHVTSDPGAAATAAYTDFAPGFREDGFGNTGRYKFLTIPKGESGIALRAPTLSDSTEEPTETFRARLHQAVELGGENLLVVTRGFARGVIYDGPTLRIAAPKGPATEGGRLRFPVTLGAPAATDISVAWKTESLAAHSAGAGTDYTAASGTLVFKAGETDKVIRVKTLQDDIDEPAEDFSVVLTDPNVVGLDLGPLRARGIIRDDDRRPAIAIGDASVTEGDPLTLPITLNPAPAVPVRLEWRVRAPGVHGATRGMDYTGNASGTITVAAGQSRANLTFPTIDDRVDEATETFEVALVVLRDAPLFFSSNRARQQQADILAPLTATATILDNDTPGLSIDDLEVTEGESAVFTVRLSSPRTHPVEVEFRTEDGGGPQRPTLTDRTVSDPARGAGPARDYDGVVTPQTIRFAPGETAKQISVNVVDDDEEESFSEYFRGIISLKAGADPTKAAIARGAGLVRIRDNDTTRYWIANRDTTVREGQSVRIRVKRDQTGVAASGLFGCLQGTGPHTARGHAGTHDTKHSTPSDKIDAYINAPTNAGSRCGQVGDGSTRASFSFAAGEDEASFWVNTVDDDRREPDETFIVWFDSSGVAGGGGKAVPQDAYRGKKVFTILDDDGIHRFRVVSANTPWEGEAAHFDIYVDSAAGLAALKASTNPFVTINIGLATDTAENGVHYRAISNRIDLDDLSSVTDPSRRVARISVPTIQDDVLDGDKTVSVHFSEIFAGVSTSLPFRPAPGGGTATATIRDDEAYHLSIDDAVGDEGDAAAVRVSLSKPAEQDFTIRFRTRQGTARAPGDFTACGPKDASCALMFPEGATEARFLVPTTEDAVPEETEQFRVVIAEVDYANLVIEDRVADVKIRDDDARSVRITGLADASVPENGAWTSPTPAWAGAPDGGVAWTLEGDDAVRFTIDPDTGVLTLPAQNFEKPADDDTDNVYEITVRVTDEDGNTAAVALSVTVTDVVYGQINVVHGAVDADGNIRVGEGVSVAPSFSYGPYREQGAVVGAPTSVSLRWEITGLAGAGAASAADVARSNAGGPHSLAYSSRNVGLQRVVLAATTDDKSPEPTETFGIELSADNDDVLFHNASRQDLVRRQSPDPELRDQRRPQGRPGDRAAVPRRRP